MKQYTNRNLTDCFDIIYDSISWIRTAIAVEKETVEAVRDKVKHELLLGNRVQANALDLEQRIRNKTIEELQLRLDKTIRIALKSAQDFSRKEVEVFIYRFINGDTYETIAQKMDISRESVKHYIIRINKRMRNKQD